LLKHSVTEFLFFLWEHFSIARSKTAANLGFVKFGLTEFGPSTAGILMSSGNLALAYEVCSGQASSSPLISQTSQSHTVVRHPKILHVL
jgi:hypothetical protein